MRPRIGGGIGQLTQSTAQPGDELLTFVNGKLLRYLRSLTGTDAHDPRDVLAQVFKETHNRMLSGYLLRDVVNKVSEINFTSADDIHTHIRNVLGINEADRQKIAGIEKPFSIAVRMGLSYRVRQEMEARNVKGLTHLCSARCSNDQETVRYPDCVPPAVLSTPPHKPRF